MKTLWTRAVMGVPGIRRGNMQQKPCLIFVIHFAMAAILLGCALTRVAPDRPAFYVNLTIDALPSGTEVYALQSENTLGERIGTTPLNYRLGIKIQNGLTSWWGLDNRIFRQEWADFVYDFRTDFALEFKLNCAFVREGRIVQIVKDKLLLIIYPTHFQDQENNVVVNFPLSSASQPPVIMLPRR